jgi:N-dimethylarginine dimethylaminohydrolase
VPDPEKSALQYLAIKSVLIESGFEIYHIPELAGHPNSVFTLDACFVTPEFS